MVNLIENLGLLNDVLEDRKDFFLTTSFGYQSSIMFFIFDIMGIVPDVVYIDNGLTRGDVGQHRKEIEKRFKFNFIHIDRREYVNQKLAGREFYSLPQKERLDLCRSSKREPLKNYIDENNKTIWITGIRKAQTENRKDTKFINSSDLNVVKVSPLAKLSDNDILEISKKYKLPVNKNYFDMCKDNESKECGLHISN